MVFKPVRPFDISVAYFTFKFFFNMAFMIEDNMLGHMKNLVPWGWRFGIKIVMLFLDFRMTGNNEIVAEKAFFNRGYSRIAGPVHI